MQDKANSRQPTELSPLTVETDGAVRLLRLNRPEKRNAMNSPLVESLSRALQETADDDDVRAVVLCGAGSAFCAGGDLSEFKNAGSDRFDEIEARSLLISRTLEALSTLPKPVIGAVHGFAYGGGAALALSCDILVLSESASLSYPELPNGIVPSLVLAGVQRHLGSKQAFAALSLGEPIPANRAFELGLANEVVDDGCHESAALELAHRLSRVDRIAMRSFKQLFHRSPHLTAADAMQAARDVNSYTTLRKMV